MVADVPVMPVALTPEMTGAWLEVLQLRTVMEYGGSERPVAPLKFVKVDDAMLTTLELSFVSVMLAEVNCCISTVPVGALAPLNVTGNAVLRDRLKTIVEKVVPCWKA
jgi:hypothetical protein